MRIPTRCWIDVLRVRYVDWTVVAVIWWIEVDAELVHIRIRRNIAVGSEAFALLGCQLLFGVCRMDPFYLLKVWQHIFPTPPRVAESDPVIVVLLSAPIPEHAVDCCSATECFAEREVARLAIEICLWCCVQLPVEWSEDVESDSDWK